MNYRLAEIFTSVQGEGGFTGAPMTFIRMAGCNVGKQPPKRSFGLRATPFQILPGYTIHTDCTWHTGYRYCLWK